MSPHKINAIYLVEKSFAANNVVDVPTKRMHMYYNYTCMYVRVWLKYGDSNMLFVPPQGVIYSSTAAANYASDVFKLSIPSIPAQRLGYPEEVHYIIYNGGFPMA